MAIDPGNTNLTAKRIRLGATGFNFSDSVGPADKADVFTFTVTKNSSFSARLTGLQANADLFLIGPDRFKSTRLGNQNESILGDIRPGTYYVRVIPKAGLTTYSLSLKSTVLPPDKGSNSLANPTPFRAAAISDRLGDRLNGVVDNNDFYRIAVGAADVGSTLVLDLNRLQANASLTLLSPTGAILRRSNKTGTQAEKITLRLTQSGNYTVQVARVDRTKKTPYTLSKTLTPPPDRGGSAFGNPVALPQWNPNTNLASNFSERLGDTLNGTKDTSDFYQFTVPGGENGSTLKFDLSNLIGAPNISLSLYREGGDGVLGAGDLVAPLAVSSGNTLTYMIQGQTGNDRYYLGVTLGDTTKRSTYTINTTFIEADNVGNALAVVDDTATDLNPLTRDILDVLNEGNTAPIVRQERVSATDEDVYNFTIGAGEQRFVSVALQNNTGAGQLGLELYKQNPGNPGNPTKVTAQALPQIAGTLGTGTYFVKVRSLSNTRIRYSLDVISKPNLAIPTLTRDIAFGPPSSNAQNLTSVNGLLYYAAQETGGGNFSLWRSNGFLDETVKLGDFGSDAPSNFTGLGDSIYFVVGSELYKTDGSSNAVELTATGTTQSGAALSLADLSILGNNGASTDSAIVGIGNYLYFAATLTGEQKNGFYRVNVNTNTLEELVPAVRADVFSNLTRVGNAVYFTSTFNPTIGGNELYRVSTAGANTVSVEALDIDASTTGNPDELTVVGDSLYFTAFSVVNNTRGLFRVRNTDDVATASINESQPFEVNINSQIFTPNPLKLVYAKDSDTLYFTADTVLDGGNLERELFKISSASGNGVYNPGFTGASVIDVNSGTATGGSPISSFTDLNNIQMVAVGADLYVVANGSTNGSTDNEFELFKIGSNDAVTQLTSDTQTGTGNPSFGSLTAVGSKLFFTLGSDETVNLWVTNNNNTGVEQREGFTALRFPSELTAVGLPGTDSARLFFKALDNSDTDRGTEVWAVDP